jgi:hypothetical protein
MDFGRASGIAPVDSARSKKVRPGVKWTLYTDRSRDPGGSFLA